jgi:hypothetical protein
VAEQSRAFFTPEEAEALRREGYADELDVPNPAVIPFTSAIASSAVAELLHRLTGFMGNDRRATEILYRFDQTEIGRNSVTSAPECQCANRKIWGAGDGRNYLGMLWGK